MSNEPLDVNDALRAGRDVRAELLDAEPVEAGQDAGTEPINLDADAPTFADAYGPADLDADRNRDLLRLDVLPGWPGAFADPASSQGWKPPPPAGHGWGRELSRLLGGGLCPRYMLAVVAGRAKAGKTSLLAQLADGFALRTAAALALCEGHDAPPDLGPLGASQEARQALADGPLTPVLWLSEMNPQALAWRTLARWTGHPSQLFRAGKVTARAQGDTAADDIFDDGRKALSSGLLADSRRFARILQPPCRNEGGEGLLLLDRTRAVVDLWRAELARAHKGREVWPVVVVDPIQRWQDSSASSEVVALNELVETLRDFADKDEWIVLLTSDTNKESAKGPTAAEDGGARAAAMTRGSYKLIHLCDSVLTLEPPPDCARQGKTEVSARPPWGDDEDGHRRCVGVSVAVNRWGVSESGNGRATALFTLAPATGRWRPVGLRSKLKAEWETRRAAGAETPAADRENDGPSRYKGDF